MLCRGKHTCSGGACRLSWRLLTIPYHLPAEPGAPAVAPAAVQSLQAELDATRQRESELTSRIAALESRDKSTGGTEVELQQQFESRLKVGLHCQCVVTPESWLRHAGLPVMLAVLQPAAVSAGPALSAPLQAQLSQTVCLHGRLRHQ